MVFYEGRFATFEKVYSSSQEEMDWVMVEPEASCSGISRVASRVLLRFSLFGVHQRVQMPILWWQLTEDVVSGVQATA